MPFPGTAGYFSHTFHFSNSSPRFRARATSERRHRVSDFYRVHFFTTLVPSDIRLKLRHSERDRSRSFRRTRKNYPLNTTVITNDPTFDIVKNVIVTIKMYNFKITKKLIYK